MILFSKEELTFKYKFYSLMDLLISNQSTSRTEAGIILSIFYLQFISSFFDQQLGIFDGNHSFIDSILNYIKRILRIKDLYLILKISMKNLINI